MALRRKVIAICPRDKFDPTIAASDTIAVKTTVSKSVFELSANPMYPANDIIPATTSMAAASSERLRTMMFQIGSRIYSCPLIVISAGAVSGVSMLAKRPSGLDSFAGSKGLLGADAGCRKLPVESIRSDERRSILVTSSSASCNRVRTEPVDASRNAKDVSCSASSAGSNAGIRSCNSKSLSSPFPIQRDCRIPLPLYRRSIRVGPKRFDELFQAVNSR